LFASGYPAPLIDKSSMTFKLPISTIIRATSFTLLTLLTLLVFIDTASAAEKVILQLKWFHQFQFAGYYAAKEKGFYAEEGLEVEIRERDPKITPSEAVLSGTAQFGIADTSLVLHRLQGKQVVVLAAIFQHSPLVLISLQESGIIGPLELKGKKVMYQRHVDDASLTAAFAEFGLTPTDIRHVPHNFKDDALLTSGIDAMSSYLTDQTFYYQKNNIDINVISPSSYGIDFYGDMLFTSENYLISNPEAASAFRRASLKGWQYALNNSAEVIDWILTRYQSKKTRAHLTYEAEMTQRMIQPALIELGHINSNRFNQIADIYKNQGLVAAQNNLVGLSYLDHIDNKVYSSKWLFFILIALIIALALSGLFFAINRRLKTLVKLRTQELENSRAELEKLSNTDALTGLNNRRKLDDFLIQQVNESERYKKQVSVILLDVDHFKRINDNFGHDVGDQILVMLAELISHNIRSADVLGRWGGEEFMIICPHTEITGAARLSELLRRIIAIHDFSIPLPIFCSFGVAQLQQDETATDLFSRVDLALYDAKQAGRNLVVTAPKTLPKQAASNTAR
jgi:diguanylate cyclase (GGDEF)-like protein